ncbi:MAG: hypothetical protein FWC36_11245 [Spirochaetes bacterium]|nr:hypothetical protein [Spirochaetota bacterium]
MMLKAVSNEDKTLYSNKTRFRLMVVLFFLVFCDLFCLVFFRTNLIKIPALYIFTACIMYLVILYKNSINKYEVGIFSFLFIQLLALAPKIDNLCSLTASTFLLSYRYGVSSRGFLGTVVDFLSNGEFISRYFVWHFIFCSLILMIFLISVYLGYFIKSNKDNIKPFVLFLSLLLLTCFASPAAYFTPNNFGRSEIYALLFMLILVAIIDNQYLKWLIPVFALFTISIHLILVFFYIPFIFILLFYKLPEKKSYIALFFVSFVVVVSSFISYLLFAKQTFMFPDAAAFVEYIKTKTDLNYAYEFIHMIFFAGFGDHLSDWRGLMAGWGFLKFSGTISVLINLPLIVLFAYFWICCFRVEQKRYMKLFFTLPVLLFVYHIPVFFMFFDFGRWMIMIILIQFMLIFYLIYVKNNTVLTVVAKMAPVINRNKWYIIVACATMLFLGPVAAIRPSDRVNHIILGFLDLLKFGF